MHIIIFSHGFGVRQDDRGLFTDIAALPNAKSILFDYNRIDQTTGTLTVPPLAEQAQKLLQIIQNTRAENPNATIDLIGHSNGCAVIGLAQPKGIRKTILTAPASAVSAEDKIKRWKERLGVEFKRGETTRLPRKDGSVTIVPPEYLESLEGIDIQRCYNELAAKTDLIIITASNDEILGKVVFEKLLPQIKIITMETGHNFEGNDRIKLIEHIAKELDL